MRPPDPEPTLLTAAFDLEQIHEKLEELIAGPHILPGHINHVLATALSQQAQAMAGLVRVVAGLQDIVQHQAEILEIIGRAGGDES